MGDRAIEVEFGLNADLLHQVVRATNSRRLWIGQGNGPTFPFSPIWGRSQRHRVDLYSAQVEQDAIDALHRAHAAGAFKPAVHHLQGKRRCPRRHNDTRAGAVLIKMR